MSHFEVCNDAVFERADCDDVAWSSAKHAFCIITDSEDLIGSCLDCDHRRLAKNNAMVFDVDQSVCCS